MAHHLSTRATAHYLHVSLERFGNVAVQEVIRRFEGVATAVHAEPGPYSLKYDERDHVFLLACQSHVGSALNEKLGHIIRDVVASGATTVTRFAECDIGDPFFDYEAQLEDEELQPLSDSASPDIHVVNFDGINPHGKAKAFRLLELPSALRSRARNRHENLANAITFRRAQWNQASETQEFGGSVGNELPKLSKDETEDLVTLFDVLVFSEFTAKVTIPKSHNPEPGFRRFEFVDEEPTVRQWLEGTGNTRQLDPEDEPEMLGDAQRFASGPPLRLNTLGRVRKPLGMTVSDLREPGTAVQADRSEAHINNSFAALMKSGADGDSDTESSESTTDEESVIGNLKAANVAELVRPASDSSVAEERTQSNDQPATDNNIEAALARTSVGHGRPGRVLAAGAGPLHHQESFPKYDKSYANVDGVGLCGDAVNQVNWENENVAQLWKHRSNSGPRTYESLALSRAESVSASRQAGRHLQSTSVTSTTPMSYAEMPLGGDEPWANNVVAPIVPVPTGTLIDTNESVQGDGRPKAPKFPPGLFPPLGSFSNQQSTKTKASVVQMGNFSAESSLKGRNIQLRDTQPTLPPNSKCEEEEELLMKFDDDDELPPIERIQPQQEDLPRLFYTMRQQASKNKNQKKKSKASNIKTGTPRPAILELPSPPPVRKIPGDTESAESQKQMSGVKNVQPTEPAPFGRLQQAIASLIESSSHGVGKTDVTIQFGLALMTNAEKLAANKALRCTELQDELDRLPAPRTSFLTVLGRKDKDGVHLLRLPTTLPGSESPYAGSSRLADAWTDCEPYGILDSRLYEITIVAPGGHEWMLVFDQGSPEEAKITLANIHQQSVYVHYPLRVWDARIRLLSTAGPEPESILKRNIMTFLSTLNTPKATCDELRPYFEATIPDAAFRVASVVAKRVLTTTLRSGTWEVTHACDLHVDSSRGCVNAFATSEDNMQKEGRVWWEAALQYDGNEEFGPTMNEVVERLDDVGWEPEVKKPSKAKEEEHIPYW